VGLAEGEPPTFVLVFGVRAALAGPALSQLAAFVPADRLFGCSTAGQIEGTHLVDETIVATCVWFERSSIKAVSARLEDAPDVRTLGQKLAEQLPREGLVHVLVLSDGTRVNGGALAVGLGAGLPETVGVSGGLAADGEAMVETSVVHEGKVSTGIVSVIGLYGAVNVGTGTLSGWIPFGPTRRITKSEGNVLSELDGESALELYKRYLGPHAAGLPSSALLFPLEVKAEGASPLVRTVLGVDDAKGTLTFAGEIPQGATVRLMHASLERLIEGASGAASATPGQGASLALLVSCVGRRMVLKQRTEEELEAVRAVLGEGTTLTGFYSYGELAPHGAFKRCELHNQTMTITTFSEAA
jgi:hypothetical protein